MSIIHQQVIANEVLSSLEMIDPSCILAGGAPRDWYLGNEASDLDLFIYLRPDLNWSWLEKQLNKALPDVEFKREEWKKELPEIYKTNKSIRAVLNFKYNKQDCQLIVMNEPTFKCVVQHFPVSICKVWYKSGRINTTQDFDRSIKHKALVQVNKLYADGSKYIAKIRSKFPDYTFYKSWEGLAKRLLDN